MSIPVVLTYVGVSALLGFVLNLAFYEVHAWWHRSRSLSATPCAKCAARAEETIQAQSSEIERQRIQMAHYSGAFDEVVRRMTEMAQPGISARIDRTERERDRRAEPTKPGPIIMKDEESMPEMPPL